MPKSIRKLSQQNVRKPSQIHAKIMQNSWFGRLLGALGEGLGRSWGGSWGSWGPNWRQDSSKSRKTKTLDPLGTPSWRPKSTKNRSEGDSKCVFFWMGCWMGFKTILVPTWLQLGSQNPPKMEPSWVQNRCELEHSFGSYFWMDVG